MAVAAHERTARQGDPEFGGDDMNDPLPPVIDVEEFDAVGPTIVANEADELTAALKGFAVAAGLRRDDMIDYRVSEMRTANMAAGAAQPGEGGCARRLLEQVTVDVNEMDAVIRLADYMRVPNLVE
jgi:hypothetical protein